MISKAEAVELLAPSAVAEILSPHLDFTGFHVEPIASGLAASAGAAVGTIVLTSNRAVELAASSNETPLILFRKETTADDIHGMEAAAGFVTALGGATSHAAVVARGMGRCCITGVTQLEIDSEAGTVRMGYVVLREGDWVSIDGLTGKIYAGKLALSQSSTSNEFLDRLLTWSSELGGIAVRANADTPQDAQRARKNGACGIGLCRTEHMFFAPERVKHVRDMILAAQASDRQRALNLLLPMQQSDFEHLFREMSGLPVTIRLIDPPLHEFLPDRDELLTALHAAAPGSHEHKEAERLLWRVKELSEINPMMGHRGCRLGITYPEIIAMQMKAIMLAACQMEEEGIDVRPEIMVPLVSCVEEIVFFRKLIADTVCELFADQRSMISYSLGTMIELPRAAVCAGAIAREVDFVSFGTNDLTQMTYGFSRDDSYKFISAYLKQGVLKDDPFVRIDRDGVGALMQIAIKQIKAVNSSVKIGVCGEHGGDPASIEFFQSLGVDYVSCSASRIPSARLAVAHCASRNPVQARVPPEREKSAAAV